jgi:hypothetical protein
MTRKRRRRTHDLSLRHQHEHQVIARLMLLGWTINRIARQLHRTPRAIRYTIATPVFRSRFDELQREFFAGLDRRTTHLLQVAILTLQRMLRHPDWRARATAIDHVLHLHGRYVDSIDLRGRVQHAHAHTHEPSLVRFGELPVEAMTDEMKTKMRELLALVRQGQERRPLPAGMIAPNANGDTKQA